MKIKKYLYRLIGKKCPCESQPQPLSAGEIKDFQGLLKNPWTVLKNKKIIKTFEFETFTQSVDFTNQIAKVAEFENHHPQITINFNKVIIELTTHDLKGLSEADFIMAAKIDEIADQI